MKQLWRIREEIPAAQSKEGGSIKHDISVPISETVKFIKTATKMVENLIPGSRICAFGHIGDGNIHFNITQPVGYDKQAFLDSWTEVNRVVPQTTAISSSISFLISPNPGALTAQDTKAPLALFKTNVCKASFSTV